MLIRSVRLWMLFAALICSAAGPVAAQDKPDQAQKEDAAAGEKAKPDAQESDESQEEEEKEPPTADDLMQEAIATARGGDLDAAIELIVKAKELAPDNARIALTLIGATQARASELVSEDKRAEANPYFYKAAALLRELNKEAAELIGPNAGNVIYNEACAYAVDGNKEKALVSLDEAFQRGYSEIESTKVDPDFESIRENAEFVALLEKHEKRILEEMLAETKTELKDFETYDFDFKLKSIEGEEIALADYKGKILIVDFWGTWCPPCVAEIPHFIELKETYGDVGLEIVGLAYEQDEEEAAIKAVKEFAEEHKLNYPCALGDEETQELVPDFQGYPTTLFIDRQGVVRLQLVGAQPHAKLEMVVKELLQAEEK